MEKDASLVYKKCYRGIIYEIHKWRPVLSHFEFSWNYYLYLNLNNFEDKDLARSLDLKPTKSFGAQHHHNYLENSFLNSIEFHCGITFYAKHLVAGRENPEETVIQIGADYQHYWDENQSYDWEDIKGDARLSIDSLHSLATYLIFCQGCGELFKEDLVAYQNEDKSSAFCPDCQTRWAQKSDNNLLTN